MVGSFNKIKFLTSTRIYGHSLSGGGIDLIQYLELIERR